VSSFYSYKQEPEIWGTFEFPAAEFTNTVLQKISELKPVGRFTYFAHWLINGRAFGEKKTLSKNEIEPGVISRVESDFEWAKAKGWDVKIEIGSHIERHFGLSILVYMRAPDRQEQGWVILEQAIIRRGATTYSLWRYKDDLDQPA
jgi:hypothetical protein